MNEREMKDFLRGCKALGMGHDEAFGALRAEIERREAAFAALDRCLHDPDEPGDRPMSAALVEVLDVVEEIEAHGHAVQCVDVPWRDEMPYVGVEEPLYDPEDLCGDTSIVYRGVEIGWPATVGGAA